VAWNSDVISDMPESHLQCRVLGHTWKRGTAVDHGGYIELTFRCASCKSSKRLSVSRYNWRIVVAARYTHADGYLVKGTTYDVDTRAQARGEYVSRYFNIIPAKRDA
jgi:hypothetical protein